MDDPKAPPPRRRFQLHLSTCVVMMVVAGILVGMNLQPYIWKGLLARGWPFADVGRFGIEGVFNAGIGALLTVLAGFGWQHLATRFEWKPIRFQLRLSTCTVMMLAAGLFVGANCRPNLPGQFHPQKWKSMHVDYYGWPVSIAFQIHDYRWPDDYDLSAASDPFKDLVYVGSDPLTFNWWPGLPWNLGVLTIVLFATAVCAESLLRKLDRSRKQEIPPHA